MMSRTLAAPLKLTALTLTMLAGLFSLDGCTVGPDYVRPAALVDRSMPSSFKEDWKTAQPQDQTIPAQWWTLFNDPNLNVLIEQVATKNQTLAQALANYRAASALVDNARAAYYPTIGADLGSTRSRSASYGPSSPNTINTSHSASLSASWEADLWGSVRRAVEVQNNTALSSFANLQALRLSTQSTLAQTYFQLRVLDAQKELLERTVQEYQRSLRLTQNQFKSGIVASDSVLQAETQLRSTEAQTMDLGVLRSQYEHAIATLIGQPASSFSIPAIPVGKQTTLLDMPDVPLALPSTLLERRPDVAAAERLMAASNAQIGVTRAAFFPQLSLAASAGYQSSTLANWISAPSRVWSVGPQLAATLFDGGARRALTNQAIAFYDADVAAYRQTVLSAFQNVEDNLASLRILKQEALVQNQASVAAVKALRVITNQYKAGTVSYLNVVTAQTAALSNQRTELTIANARLVATVQLIAALGGGWEGL